MVCFPSCFRGSKRVKKIKHSFHSTSPLQNQGLGNNATVMDSELKEITKQEEAKAELTKEEILKKSITETFANTDATKKKGSHSRKGEETSEPSMGPCYSDEQRKDGTDTFHNVHDDHGKIVEDNLIEQESSESLFSLSINSRKQGCASAADHVDDEVESPMMFSKNYSIISAKETDKATGSVLNPIQNITHWKAVKATTAISQSQSFEDEDEENIRFAHIFPTSLDIGPIVKIFTPISKLEWNDRKQAEEVVMLDTSLSNWLAESDTTPKSKGSRSTDSVGNSPLKANKSIRNENRQTLRTLNMEEMSMPIVGTVRSYWRCTGQTMDSDSNSSHEIYC